MIFYKYFDEISVRFIPFHVKASSIVSILFAMKNRLHEKKALSLTPLCLVIFMTLNFDLFLIIFFFFVFHHRRHRTVEKLETEQNFFFLLEKT